MDTEIKKAGNVTIIRNPVGCYSFSVAGSQQLASPSFLPFYQTARTHQPVKIGDFFIVPFGEQNNYPDEIRALLDENNLTPEILNKKAQLNWGQGPALYREKFIEKDGRTFRVKEWVNEPTIMSWLRSWDFEEYLLKANIEFNHINGHFTKFIRNRGPRIGGKGIIAKLEHVTSAACRLEWPDAQAPYRSSLVMKPCKNIIVGDFSQPWNSGLTSYPVFDPDNPFAYPIAMRYSNLYAFALDNEYSRSPFHGTMNWIREASSIAKLLINFNENSAAIKYHITSPAAYWDKKQIELEDKCMREGIEYKASMLADLKDEIFTKFTDALAGTDNVGKFITTEKLFDEVGNQYIGWEINTLDQKVKDYIDAQLSVAKTAALQTTMGLGLHPALSNISADGNLPSGSEQLYSFKLYLATGVDIPEGIICKDINLAIRSNFPDSDLKIGFYHDVVLTEESTSPKERVKNAV